jgi:dihydropyrimidinase
MTTIIKNGTVVTADLTYKSDVRNEGRLITEIGPGLGAAGQPLIRSLP